MRIALLLPNYSGCVVGSLLVYYNYAIDLAEQGHEVDVYHPLLTQSEPDGLHRARIKLAVAFRNSLPNPVGWMKFPRKVHLRFRSLLQGLELPHDLVVAFSWRAVEALGEIKTRGRLFGYIVEYEAWAEADAELRARMEVAYRNGSIPMLASSKAVEGMLRMVGAVDPRLCIHGVDTDRLRGGKTVAPRERDRRRVGFPVRVEPVKSPEVLSETVKLLKKRHGENVVIWGFGAPSVPSATKALFDEFHAHPTDAQLASLYEGSAIFAVPSRREGFGMPAAEAMAHGCAVVSTDNGGVHTFGIHGENCLLVPPENPAALVESVSLLLEDQELRWRLAERSPDSVAFLQWSLAGARFREQLGL